MFESVTFSPYTSMIPYRVLSPISSSVFLSSFFLLNDVLFYSPSHYSPVAFRHYKCKMIINNNTLNIICFIIYFIINYKVQVRNTANLRCNTFLLKCLCLLQVTLSGVLRKTTHLLHISLPPSFP